MHKNRDSGFGLNRCGSFQPRPALAGRGRREAPGEGLLPRVRLSPTSRKQPLTPALSPPRAGGGGRKNRRPPTPAGLPQGPRFTPFLIATPGCVMGAATV